MSEKFQKKDEELLRKRLKELYDMSYRKNIPLYSDFLTPYEQSLFYTMKFDEELSFLIGGYDMAERKIAVFLPYSGCEYNSPIRCLKIVPLSEKFSQDLNHRDFLGSILGLGLERCLVGDIVVKNNSAFVFCHTKMCDYIISNLTRIKHTSVNVAESYEVLEDVLSNFEEITGSVSSLRLDSILALAFNISRSKIITYIEEGLVFVNGRLITTNSYGLKDNDTISVRHLGKFKFLGIINTTRKGKLSVKIQKYI